MSKNIILNKNALNYLTDVGPDSDIFTVELGKQLAREFLAEREEREKLEDALDYIRCGGCSDPSGWADLHLPPGFESQHEAHEKLREAVCAERTRAKARRSLCAENGIIQLVEQWHYWNGAFRQIGELITRFDIKEPEADHG